MYVIFQLAARNPDMFDVIAGEFGPDRTTQIGGAYSHITEFRQHLTEGGEMCKRHRRVAHLARCRPCMPAALAW